MKVTRMLLLIPVLHRKKLIKKLCQHNPLLTPHNKNRSNTSTDIEYESYLKNADTDTNEKVDTKKNVGNNAKLTLN